MKGITRCKLTIISESPFVRNSFDRLYPTQPVYRFQIVINRMLCCYLNVFVFVYINGCIDVNTALKNSFKSMSCSGRIHQFPRKFLCWQAPGCIQLYSFKSMVTLAAYSPWPLWQYNKKHYPFWAQCYKNFYVRNLEMFVLSESKCGQGQEPTIY